MSKKNFILLSMEDEKIKKISNVISNDSCRKILDHLAEKEATESELASKLSIPISTVHYNLQQLMETGLVEANEFHYSQKGKEVNHYRLANKYIIIAPKKTFGIKEKLKGIIPAALITAAVAGVMEIVTKYSNSMSAATGSGADMAMKSPAMEAAPSMMQAAAPSASAVQLPNAPNIALWFLAGAVAALLIYLLISILRKNVD